MKLRMTLGCLAIGGAMLLGAWTGDALAEGKAAAKNSDTATAAKKTDQSAEMAEWAKYANPGKPHEYLKAMEGTWTAQSKMWMDPKSPPQESTGTSEHKLIMGGRFLQQDFHGQMMGKPFEGQGLTGYDNFQKKYVSTWIDTMGTMIMVSQGTVDPSGKVLTTVAEYDNPATGKKQKSRMVTRVESDKKLTYEMYDAMPDGKEVKVLQVVYTRK